MRKVTVFVLLSCILLVSCEGPAGPVGPAGPRGPAGEDAELEIALVEFSISEAAWEVNDWQDSYVFFDQRITPDRLVEVYVKRFYNNTGGVYYETFNLWVAFAESTSGNSTFWQLFEDGIRFYDPDKRLQGQTIIVAIRS